MLTFWEWLSQLRLLGETYYGLDRKQYDAIFDSELENVIARTHDAKHLQALEQMRGFRWLAYIITCVRRMGWLDQREIEEHAHDIASKLLLSTLFTGFDERRSGPMDLRFRASVRHAILYQLQKEKTRRRIIPTVTIGEEPEPGQKPPDDEQVIHDFRRLVQRRLGRLGVTVLDVRLAGEQTQSLVGNPSLGNPDKNIIKRVVCQIKQLAREFGERLGDPDFQRMVEKAMKMGQETVEKRRATVAARRAVGA